MTTIRIGIIGESGRQDNIIEKAREYYTQKCKEEEELKIMVVEINSEEDILRHSPIHMMMFDKQSLSEANNQELVKSLLSKHRFSKDIDVIPFKRDRQITRDEIQEFNKMFTSDYLTPSFPDEKFNPNDMILNVPNISDESELDSVFEYTNLTIRKYMSISSSTRELADKKSEILYNASLYAKDLITHGHVLRVSKACEIVARQLNWSKKEVEEARQAGLFHDIGKLITAERVLKSGNTNTGYEQDLMALHAPLGEISARQGGMPRFIQYVAAIHHQRDLANKPDLSKLQGLSSERQDEIIKLTKLVVVQDCTDAFTAHRGYNKPRTVVDALCELLNSSETVKSFDPEYPEEREGRFNEEIGISTIQLHAKQIAQLGIDPVGLIDVYWETAKNKYESVILNLQLDLNKPSLSPDERTKIERKLSYAIREKGKLLEQKTKLEKLKGIISELHLVPEKNIKPGQYNDLGYRIDDTLHFDYDTDVLTLEEKQETRINSEKTFKIKMLRDYILGINGKAQHPFPEIEKYDYAIKKIKNEDSIEDIMNALPNESMEFFDEMAEFEVGIVDDIGRETAKQIPELMNSQQNHKLSLSEDIIEMVKNGGVKELSVQELQKHFLREEKEMIRNRSVEINKGKIEATR